MIKRLIYYNALTLLTLFATCCPSASGEVSPVSVTVASDKEPIFETFEEYLSVDLDWWTGENGRTAWKDCGLLSIDLQNVRLKNLAKGLGGGFLRLGGSLDVAVKYLYSKQVETWCKTPAIHKGKKWNLCLNFSRWDEINEFAMEANLKLVFGMSYPGTNLNKNSAVPPLDVTQNLALLKYSISKGYRLAAVELGEEIVPPDQASFKNFVDAYKLMSETIVKLWPNASYRPKLLGPCLGMGSAVGKDKCVGNSTCQVSQLVKDFMDAVVHNEESYIDGYCMHGYNNDGGNGWKQAGFLSEVLHQAVALKSELRKRSSTMPLWLGESGPHNHGGIQNVTDRFISSLWYADALGKLASIGVSEFGRQALVGSYYALLDVTNGFAPNPDYFTALIWRKLMGTKVLSISLGNLDEGGNSDVFHAYAHCSNMEGKVAVLFVNIDEEKSFKLNLEHVNNTVIDLYHLTPHKNNLYSKLMDLNGDALLLEGDDVPSIKPQKVNLSNGEVITATPSSFGFVLYNCGRNNGCVCV